MKEKKAVDTFTNKLSTFDRVIPQGGLKVYPGVWYYDVNDISEETRKSVKKYFRNSPDYKPYYSSRYLVPKGTIYERRFCVYIYHRKNLLGNFLFIEYLDSPFGYGKEDFYYTKWVVPKYQGTKYSRYASGDLMHMLFVSKVANNLYSLPIAGKDNKVDPSQPCVGIIYPTDGPNIQKYILRKRLIPTEWKSYILTEYNGDIYRSMDLKKYLLSNPKRTEEIADRWLKEMNKAAVKVKETVEI